MTSSTHIAAAFSGTQSDRVMFLVGDGMGHSTCYFERSDIVAWCAQHRPELVGTDERGCQQGFLSDLSADELNACFKYCRQMERERHPERVFEVGVLADKNHPFLEYATSHGWGARS